jgi:hypothetical protein
VFKLLMESKTMPHVLRENKLSFLQVSGSDLLIIYPVGKCWGGGVVMKSEELILRASHFCRESQLFSS